MFYPFVLLSAVLTIVQSNFERLFNKNQIILEVLSILIFETNDLVHNIEAINKIGTSTKNSCYLKVLAFKRKQI